MAKADAKSKTLHPTNNDLPLSTRQAMVTLLGERLLDALDLAMQCKQAHWTIKGPTFAALHEMFDEAHDEVRSMADDIAERAAALGGHVIGTAEATAKGTSLPAFPTQVTDGIEQAKALAKALGVFSKHARAAIEKANSADDAVTGDLFTGICRVLDKRLWMIESHTQH